MASLGRFEPRKCWRVRCTLQVGTQRRRRAFYARSRSDARTLLGRLEQLEQATRSSIATRNEIDQWVQSDYLRPDEAAACFPGWAETQLRNPALRVTDFAAILSAFEDHALRRSKARDPMRRTFLDHMSLARRVLAWLQDQHPELPTLTVADVEAYKADLEYRYRGWTVHHRLTTLRVLLDRAQELGMVIENPARAVRVESTPKTATVRHTLTPEEIHRLLEVSLSYRQWVYGGLPSAVRLGLYAGLRREEMCWCRWDWLDDRRRILIVQEAHSVSGQTWVPKDYEARRLDVKAVLTEYLAEDRNRQEALGRVGPFILAGKYEGKPLGTDALQHSFSRMVTAEGMDRRITLHALRHTYCTELLRAGVDLRTVQRRMGHSSIRTTEVYLHALDPEAHPTDALP